jgi:hypothetical protein
MHSSAKMLSLLSSRYNSLRLTQTTHAYIVLNASCKKSDYKFAECVIILLSFGYHLLQSKKQGFVFLEKSFSCFQGVQSAPGSGAACPFLGHSCFQNKCFAVFRGCNRRPGRVRHVLFWGIRVFEKKLLPKSGHKMAQNGPKWPKTAQNCIIICAHVPFWDILILNLNVLPKSGHAILCVFFITCNQEQMHDT